MGESGGGGVTRLVTVPESLLMVFQRNSRHEVPSG